ncbi:MAG: TetR/AcrR family transcriptional regulator [Bacteroidales bacterium]|nr:TetR/AcrR family transcriptional regulator [Bacteroidales bacterium]
MGILERKEREKEQRRNDIIDAAERVFLKKGFENATVDHVAEEAELSKGTVYLYFNSKEELHFAINLRGMEILNSLIQQAYNPDKDAIANLEIMGMIFIRFAEEHQIFFSAMLHFESKSLENIDKSLTNRLLEDGSPIPFLVKLIDRGKKEGTIREDLNSHLIVKLLWSQIMGVLQFIFYKKTILEMFKVTPDEVLSGLFEILKNGVRKSIS